MASAASTEAKFEDLYRRECKKRKESPVWASTYALLDAGWMWTSTWTPDQQKGLKASLDPSRVCMMVPPELVQMVQLPNSLHKTESKAPLCLSRYQDAEDAETRAPLYASSPGTDLYRFTLLHYLADKTETTGLKHAWDDDVDFLRWAIRRYEKLSSLGSWAEYEKAYK